MVNAKSKLFNFLIQIRELATVRTLKLLICISEIYMASLDTSDTLPEEFRHLSKKAAEYLDEATEIFQHVNDVPNLALLYCNKARYMRFKVHCDKGVFE